MMGTVTAFPAAKPDATAMVRVTTADSRVHYASLRLFNANVADRAELSTPSPLVADCKVRLTAPMLALGPVSCTACAARAHVHQRNDVTDVTVVNAYA
jgi:hypothetical protein